MSRPILFGGISVANDKTLRLHVTSDPAGKLYVEVMAPDSVVFTFCRVSKTGVDKVTAIKTMLADPAFASERFQEFLKGELGKRVLVAKEPKARTKEPKTIKVAAPKVTKTSAEAADIKAKNLAEIRSVAAMMKDKKATPEKVQDVA